MSRRRTDNPVSSTVRGRRHAALRKLGYSIYRVPVHEGQLTALVRDGCLPDHLTSDQAAVERALADWLAKALPVVK